MFLSIFVRRTTVLLKSYRFQFDSVTVLLGENIGNIVWNVNGLSYQQCDVAADPTSSRQHGPSAFYDFSVHIVVVVTYVSVLGRRPNSRVPFDSARELNSLFTPLSLSINTILKVSESCFYNRLSERSSGFYIDYTNVHYRFAYLNVKRSIAYRAQYNTLSHCAHEDVE